MDVQVRRAKAIHLQDQENVYVGKTKGNVVLPTKRQELPVRGVLGELTNAQTRREIVGKVAVAAAEFEKKATLGRSNNKNYGHIQSKVDTGLSTRSAVQPAPRPPLRRQESTAGHAARAVAQTRGVLKETQNKPNDLKEVVSSILQAKKNVQEKKSKLPGVKELKDRKALKPILKESTRSLEKLNLSQDSKVSVTDNELELSPRLPEDIEDIDDKDNNNPFLMSMYIKDIYRYLTQLEDKYSIKPDHLKEQTEITGKMRATLIDWLVEVQTQFSLLLETFHLTVGIIDRYLQLVPNVKRNRLQLVGVAAMFIASKYEEVYAPSVADFVFVTDNAYTKQDVFQCERDIMSKLGFCLARPIPLSFLRRFVKAANGEARHHHLAKYFVDLSLVEYTMSHYRPSELAAASMCLSIHLLTNKKLSDVWTRTMAYYSGYSLEHIEPIIKKIAKIVVNIEKSSYKAVQKKYLDKHLAKVASFPQLKGATIRELAEYA